MFDTNLILKPLWDTGKVIRETVLFREDQDCPLLFVPEEILEITNLAGDIRFEEGMDWELRDGKLHRLPGSRLDEITDAELFPAEAVEDGTFPMPGGFSLFTPQAQLILRQAQVTYTCQPEQWTGVRPESARAILPRTFAALEAKRPLRLLLNGDSISVGAQCTGSLNLPPWQPNYGQMLTAALEAHYGAPVEFINTSVGGMDSTWAVENLEANILQYKPDLLIIAFGMNDGWKTPEHFGSNIRAMVAGVRERCPDCEIILVATSLPNPILTDPQAHFWGNQQYFLPVLEEIAADPVHGGHIAVANISDMHRYLLTKKRFLDLTSNNVNHPNDFFYRLYAQFLTGMLTES